MMALTTVVSISNSSRVMVTRQRYSLLTQRDEIRLQKLKKLTGKREREKTGEKNKNRKGMERKRKNMEVPVAIAGH